jgi:hypothetical protein
MFLICLLTDGTPNRTLKVSRYDFHKLTSSVPKWGLGIQGGYLVHFGISKVETVVTFSPHAPYPQPQAGTSACLSLGGTGGSARAADSSFHF